MPHYNRGEPTRLSGCISCLPWLILPIICVWLIGPQILVRAIGWFEERDLANKQQEAVDWVLKHAYSNAKLVQAEAASGWGSAGNSVYSTIWVTFESPDPFDVIESWYFEHPEGGWGNGIEGRDLFPYQGLEELNKPAPNKTFYRVHYRSFASCAFGDCERESHKIR